jgi:hypothetical protein
MSEQSGSNIERPIEVHGSGEAYAIGNISEKELQRLRDGESFWKVVEDIDEFAPGGGSDGWEWSVDADRREQ